jgi:probable rRNA maturation factor
MPKVKVSSAPSAVPVAPSASRYRLDVEVTSEEPEWTCLGGLDAASAVAAVAMAVAANAGLPAAITTASLVLANDARVRDLNRQWRQQDKPTNVLSFPSGESPHGDGAEHFIGDVIIAEETLVREAREQGITAADHFHHLALHGLLHLIGYDHETACDAEAMEALEISILAALGIADPYADTEPVAPAAPSSSRTVASRK